MFSHHCPLFLYEKNLLISTKWLAAMVLSLLPWCGVCSQGKYGSLFQEGKQWTYFMNYSDQVVLTLSVGRDTLMDGREWHVINSSYTSSPNILGKWLYLREEDGKVYSYNSTTGTASLYFDFTADVGDTIRWGEEPVRRLVVTGIDHVDIKGHVMRRLTYQNIDDSGSAGAYTGQWVEGIGSERGIICHPSHQSPATPSLYPNYMFLECSVGGETFCEKSLFFGDGAYGRRMVAGHPGWTFALADGDKVESVEWNGRWMSYMVADIDKDKYVFDVFKAPGDGDGYSGSDVMLYEEAGRVCVPIWSEYVRNRYPDITPYGCTFGYGLQPLHLLYDFTLGLGEKYPCLGDVIVERVDTITTRDGLVRRVQHLSNGLVIVEGVGCVNSPLGPFAYQCWTDTLSASGKYGRGWLESYVKDGEVVFDKDDLRALGLYDGGTVAVKEAATPPPTPNANNTYDLQGRRLQAPPVQGVYIRNGKKMVIK